MLTLPTFFEDFLSEIRPTKPQKDEYKASHELLRKRLNEFEALKPFIISTFLQGSYKRSTAVRPKDGSKSDVDIVVVTNFDSSSTKPKEAMDKFKPFLDKYYEGKWGPNDRSFGIQLSNIKLDLVITAAPNTQDVQFLKSSTLLSDDYLDEIESTVELNQDWKPHSLLIPDRSTLEWDETHPIEQIRWTVEKNRRCNKHYINVVKALKWWRKVNYETPKYPKGYPFEHLIGQCCPDGIQSVAEGVTRTLEQIVSNYKYDAGNDRVPNLPDHGVPSHNVMKRVTPAEFKEFYLQVVSAAQIARRALEETSKIKATQLWRELFGDKFDIAEKDISFPPDGPTPHGFTPRTNSTTLNGGRYARHA